MPARRETARRGGITMDKRLQRLILATGIVGSTFVLAGGCSVNRTPRGWVVRSGYTMEYSPPFRCAFHGPASGKCNPANMANMDENSAVGEPSGEALSSDSADKLIGNSENSPWLRLLQRRGRLGICANCKKMMHMGGSAPPPTAGAVTVNAKFNPVPTQPVFTARQVALDTGNFHEVPSEPRSPGQPLPLPPPAPSASPEEIPAPPAVSEPTSSQRATSQDHSSWVFSKPPAQKPDPVVEIPPASAYGNSGATNNPRGTHASQPSTRR
jgi:hypothetical protein